MTIIERGSTYHLRKRVPGSRQRAGRYGGHRRAATTALRLPRFAVPQDQQPFGRDALGQHLAEERGGGLRLQQSVQRGEDGFAAGGHGRSAGRIGPKASAVAVGFRIGQRREPSGRSDRLCRKSTTITCSGSSTNTMKCWPQRVKRRSSARSGSIRRRQSRDWAVPAANSRHAAIRSSS